MTAHDARTRTIPCCICARDLVFASATNPHPECPEMLNPPSDAVWMGIVHDADEGPPELVVACSIRCLDVLLADQKEQEPVIQ